MIVWQTFSFKSRAKSAKMAESEYFEIGCKKTAFWENLKFMNLIFGIFGKKLILKHFMYRTIPKSCVLGVFWTIQYVSEVYFIRRSLLLTLLTSLYGYNDFGCIYILLTLKNKKQKFSIHQPLYFGGMFLNGTISPDFCKKPRNFHFDLNSVFSLSYKISFADLRSLFTERITYSLFLQPYVPWLILLYSAISLIRGQKTN